MEKVFTPIKAQGIPRIPYDFYSWQVEGATKARQEVSRIEAGIGAMDTWNFENYIAALIANTVSYVAEREYPRLSSESSFAWDSLKIGRNDILTHDSFDEEFVFIITTLQACAIENYDHGVERTNAALRSFFTLLPYMEIVSESEKEVENQYPDIDDYFQRDHTLQRTRFILSRYDAESPYYHVTSTLAVGFKVLAETTHGYPGDLTEQEWDEYLRDLSVGFKEYSEGMNPTAFSDDFMEKFISRFHSYWD